MELGEKDESRKCLQMVIDINPHFYLAKKSLENLKSEEGE